jgi:hypothetical protein
VARELADVIHYFLDEPGGGARPGAPLLALPVAEKQAVRLAFVWNLAVELARTAGRPSLLVPEGSSVHDGLPAPAVGGVLAPELVLSAARSLSGLARDARPPARTSRGDSLRLAAVPAEWVAADPGSPLLAWTLLFATPDPADLDASLELAIRVARGSPSAEVGVTLHGVESVAEARAAFVSLAGRFEAELGRPLRSYGLLLDELLVYRAAVERRPVVLSHPQSLAARSLADVARLVVSDAGRGSAEPAP